MAEAIGLPAIGTIAKQGRSNGTTGKWYEFKEDKMTYDPNDVNRPITDDAMRTGVDAPGTYSRPPSNTGVIGAIIGVLAVVAVVFFVWRGYEGNEMNHATTSAPTSTTSPAPAPATTAPTPAPAAPKAP
ncbi:hypothetical protein ABEG18_04905 [Alsobacter sp. KACC 23698]|uniref:Uncharacterized protein n=1 Tax=Alsobacter sp. KACC 23698 TaxID=3149229 RepID=A0AAU7JIA8_9HYPH